MRPNISNCHALPGTLIIFEGPDGSGKSTQIQLTKKLLEKEGKSVTISEWKTAPVLSNFMHQDEKKQKFPDRILPETSLFMQSADFLYRIEREIIPALKQGHIVLCDRGVQTLIVRGLMIGMTDIQLQNGLLWWKNTIYKELFDKSKILYFTITTDESLKRLQERTILEQREIFGKKFNKHKVDGTLLALQFINTLVYSPDGKKMTRHDKKLFIRDTQAQIIETYKQVFQDGADMYFEISGMLNKEKISNTLKNHVLDLIF